MGGLQATRVEGLDRTRRHHHVVDHDVVAHADDEKTRTGMRNEKRGVDHQRAIAVPVICERLADRFEVPAAV